MLWTFSCYIIFNQVLKSAMLENNCVGDLDFFRVIFNQVFYRKGVGTIK